MPNFLENFFAQLEKNASRVVIREIRGETFLELTGAQLLQQIRRAQEWISQRKLAPGDRVAIIGPNSMRWIAIDLALMAEGLVVVPLYSRQAPGELVAVMRDCQPKMLIADGGALRSSIIAAWPAGSGFTFDTVLVTRPPQRSELSKKVWTIWTCCCLRKRLRSSAARNAVKS